MDKLFAKLFGVFEDFEPTIEWLHDVDHDTLLVYLPDFRRNQLKLLASSTQKLKINGERALGKNKWRRFKTEVVISSNYDSDNITAKFEKGVLHVKHPKKIKPTTTTQIKPQENASQAMPETVTETYDQDAIRHNTPQKASSGDRNCGGDSIVEEAQVVTNSGEVCESGVRCNYGEVVWVRVAEFINKPRKGGKLEMFVGKPRHSASLVIASFMVLVIGIYAKTALGVHVEAEN